MKIRAILFCLTICALLALPAIAQDNVRLVVSVTSGDGAPVRDLKKTDFTVQDAGKPRTIDNFVAAAAMPGAPPQQGAGQFTNAPDVTHSGAIFVVLDTIHTRSAEHTAELQSLRHLVCRLLLEKKTYKLHISATRISLLYITLSSAHRPTS